MSQLLLAQTYKSDFSSLAFGTIQSTNGDYIIAGRSFDDTSKSSAFALRTNPGGELIWNKIYSSSFLQFFNSITQIADGNFIATGSYFYSDLSGDEYIWVVKINENGEIIWEKTVGNRNHQNDGYDVTATSDGDFIITGLVLENNREYTWILKFDANGNLEWDKIYDGGVAYSIQQTKDGGYILSGTHYLTNSLNNNIYVLRLDTNGDKIWDKIYTEFEIYVLLDSSITETIDGHFVLAAKSVVWITGIKYIIIKHISHSFRRLFYIICYIYRICY